MESEKEKKEKLASARRKLNEYKMTRSGGGGGRYQNASSASTKPADVPLFYQNINSQATAFNIFNPAAADNNNASSSPYFLSTPGSGENGSNTPSDYPSSFSFQQQPLTSTEESKPIPEVNPPFFVPEPPAAIDPFNSSVKSSPINTELVGSSDHQHQQPAFYQPVTLDSTTDVAMASAAFSESIPSNLFGTGFPAAETTNCTFQEAQKDERGNDLQSTLEGFGNQEDLVSTNSPSAPSIVYGSETPAEVVDPPLTDAHEKKVYDISNFNTQDSRPTDESEAVHSNNEIENTTAQLFASSLFSSGGAAVGDNERDIFNIVNNQEPSATTISNMSSTELLESIPATFSTALTSSNVNPVIANPSEEIPFVFNGNFADGKDITFMEKSSEVSIHPNIPNVSGEPQENNADVPSGPAGTSDVSEGNIRIESAQSYHAQTVGFGLAPIQTADETTRHDVAPSIQQEINSHPATPEDVQVQKKQEILLETNNVSNSIQSDETFQHMKSVQEALELQIEELRRENNYLLTRQTELTTRIEESEKLAHDFKLARDQIKEESMATSQALRGKINSLCEENQRIVKNSTDVGVDLRAKLEEKSKQLEEMQKAVIIVSQSKMDFAERLDHEAERAKELQNTLREKDNEINSLRSSNAELQSKLKQEQETDAVIQQLQDQNRHFQVQNETLQKELSILKRKIHKAGDTRPAELSKPPDGEDQESRQHLENQTSPKIEQSSNEESPLKTYPIEMPEASVCGHDHDHDASNGDGDHHDHDHHHHDHHDHDHHDHDHSHDNNHHNHDHIDDKNVGTVARRGPTDEVTELKKTVHRLQWENSTYREELDILAVDAKDKRTYEQKCTSLQEENDGLKKEVEQLEHVIIQLQGENDTIGDYITLYQTQRLALKECAKEKDAQLELLAREREMLLHRLAELTALVKDLRDTKSEAGSQCADEHDHIHSLDMGNPHLPQGPKSKHQIEGKIRDLLSEISSSTLIENFHPCALCSGRLMTV